MNIVRTRMTAEAPASCRSTVAAIALALACASTAFSQQPTSTATPSATLLMATNVLPDSPGAVLAKASQPSASATEESSSSLSAVPEPRSDEQHPVGAPPNIASVHEKYIDPGQPAPKLTVRNKLFIGAVDSVSPYHAIGWAVTAGYQQAVNGSPNYGTNGPAFAQRFGAAAARASSQSVFGDSILASALHEDPRYYRLGPGNNVVKRLGYAITRTFVTRTDGGRTTANLSLLGGNLGGAYLTKTYYPVLNQSNTEIFKTFGGSVGGSALSFVVAEFFGDGFGLFRHNPLD